MDKKPYRLINLFKVKTENENKNFVELLNEEHEVSSYEIDPSYGFNGMLFVKNTELTPPKWAEFAEDIVGTTIDELGNKSSSAVLFLKTDNGVFAITFGYGRFLLDIYSFVFDFGIKTALNTLDHESLRSVDIHTLEDQPIQKKTQATRESDATVFGIDISRDILRAVTGTPKNGIHFRNISGGDSMYTFGKEMEIDDLPGIINQISDYYCNDDYKEQFSWVDNVQRIKVKGTIEELDEKLLSEIKTSPNNILISIPEIEKWDTIIGFSFTRSKDQVSPTINSENYYSKLPKDTLSIEKLKKDKLFIYDIYENEKNHPIYKCLYWELVSEDKTFILFGGIWYAIANLFIARINEVLEKIEISDITFPSIETWTEKEEKEVKNKIETEGDYNERIASSEGFFLMDKKLIKTNKTTSAIELCDLLTEDGSFIHAKHRKGGSSGLSHLFAQGVVSAELVLGDKEFRKKARQKLNMLSPIARDVIPLDNPRGNRYSIIYLILGEVQSKVKSNLPFFSKVNLSKAYDNLSQRGFKVKIAAAEKTVRV